MAATFILQNAYGEISDTWSCGGLQRYICRANVRVSLDGFKANIPDDDKVNSYMQYFKQTWMNGQFKHARGTTMPTVGPRTNNHLEGWYRGFPVACQNEKVPNAESLTLTNH